MNAFIQASFWTSYVVLRELSDLNRCCQASAMC